MFFQSSAFRNKPTLISKKRDLHNCHGFPLGYCFHWRTGCATLKFVIGVWRRRAI